MEAILRGGFGRILLAGIATGLAWWTKYNGWLPLAILLSGTVAWLVVHRPKTVSIISAAARWMAIAVVAGIVWSPVLMGLQDKGGYASVAANHKGYLNSIGDWPSALIQQVVNHRIIELSTRSLWLPFLIVLMAVTLARRDPRFTWKHVPQSGRTSAIFKFVCGFVALGLSILTVGTAPTLVVVALGGLIGSLVWPVEIPTEGTQAEPSTDAVGDGDRRTLLTWIVLAWLIGMFVATPAYRPYPRLTLPLLIAAWLGSAIGIARWIRATRNVAMHSTGRSISLGYSVLAAGLGFVALTYVASVVPVKASAVRSETNQLNSVVEQIEQTMGDQKFVTFTYGEPALMHLLNAAGHTAVPTVGLTPPPTHGFQQLIVVGDQARRSADFESQWAGHSHLLKSVLVCRFRPTDIVALNDPQTAATLKKFYLLNGPPPEATVEVFRVVSGLVPHNNP